MLCQKVVSNSVREEYIQSIFGAHSARSNIDTSKNLARAGLTFSGPMMAGDLSDELNSDDEEEKEEGGGGGGGGGRGGDIQLEELDEVGRALEAEEKKAYEDDEDD